MMVSITLGLLAFIALFVVIAIAVRKRSVLRWLLPLIVHQARARKGTTRDDPNAEIHLILAIADHYEPDHGGASKEAAMARVNRWRAEYPRVLGDFRDFDGVPPQHTFFYPIEVYDADEVEGIAELCRKGFGEVEIHLHHDRDTAETLKQTLEQGVKTLSENHELLSRDRETGAPGYAFVHGNWALNNSRPDGSWCGVNDEISVLLATGCYADLTFPSEPSPPTSFLINRHYYAQSTPDRPCGHDRGTPVGARTPPPTDALMLIQGPLLLNWRNRKWGLLPRLENGCVQTSQPATIDRVSAWLKAGITVPSRPDWRFVKLYAHGAPEHDQPALIGEPMAEFHRGLARLSEENPRFHYHYVTAREMYNLIRAAESGWTGDVDSARDFERERPPSSLPKQRAEELSGVKP